MASNSDAGFFGMSPSRTVSSPSLLRGLQRSGVKPATSPRPKPILGNVSSPLSGSKVDSPSSPSSPSKYKTKGDRFIPDRSSNGFSVSQFALSQESYAPSDSSPSVEQYKRCLARSMFEGDSGEVLASEMNEVAPNLPQESSDHIHSDSIRYIKGTMSTGRLNSPKSPSKMLTFSPRNGTPSGQNSHRVLFTQTQSLRRKTTIRVIPTIPERVLDAPGIIDDYYLNLLDWSSSNLVGIALEGSVFVWNATSGESQKLFTLQGYDSYVASLSFSGTGQYLAMGTHDQLVRIWDVEAGKMVRTIAGHSGRVGALSWNDHLISSGSRDALINTHDVRMGSSRINTFERHSNEVCGLKWSPDGTQLASGSNDNTLNIWSLSYQQPIYTFEQHNAAVKALAWCPWQRNLLASGGGTADKTIKFWSTSLGTCLHSIDTKSQVCSLQWSKHVKELVSSHGFSQNQLAIWKYPTMVKQAELTGHANRVLHTAMSPDGTTVVSASADETIRFWRVFDVESALSKLPKSHSEANLRRKMLR